MERNRIFSLESHGKALRNVVSGIFCDSGDTPANLLCELNGHLMPCTSCLASKWVEDCVLANLEYLSDMELGHWVTGPMSHLGSGSPGHHFDPV